MSKDWDYRIIHETDELGESFTVRTVGFDGNGEPVCCSDIPEFVAAGSVENLAELIGFIVLALGLPALELADLEQVDDVIGWCHHKEAKAALN